MIVHRLLYLAQFVAVCFGVTNELVSQHSALKLFPSGMGAGLAVTSATMAFVLLVVDRERERREVERRAIDTMAEKLSLCIPFHEREFYSLWPTHVDSARNNVDVTHLGPRAPQLRHGEPERAYFDSLKKLYKNTKAQVRRVERLTDEKKPWIRDLVEQFKGAKNVSLAVYKDPSDEEMPAAMSISRVDDRYAWIVALAEQKSTGKYRDLLVTHPDTVELLKRYFEERLWKRAILILDQGTVKATELKQILG